MHIIIQAAILRTFPGDPGTLSLYTPAHGRLIVSDARRRTARSACIVGDIGHATLASSGGQWFLQQFESLVTQPKMSNSDIFFWRNHLLDIYFFYVPLCQPNEGLFALLVQTLRTENAPPLLFKLFITHFFCLQGYHVPEDVRWYRPLLAQALETHPFVLHAEPEAELSLDVWLKATVVQHNHFQYLKTHHFLPQLYSTVG